MTSVLASAVRRHGVSLLALGLLATLPGCKRKHLPVDTLEEIPFPVCVSHGQAKEALAEDGGTAALGGDSSVGPDSVGPERSRSVVVARQLRGTAASMAESSASETFELRPQDCLFVFRAREEFGGGLTESEVVFNQAYEPLVAWKRLGHSSSSTLADTRWFELRTAQVGLLRKERNGTVAREHIRGKVPKAVIGPGRGVLTAWIRRSHLAVGAKVREPVLDFRENLEVIRDVTLKREPDRFEASLGRTVRVYTIYGREPVFTDETDAVLGDLDGKRTVAEVDERSEVLGRLRAMDTRKVL